MGPSDAPIAAADATAAVPDETGAADAWFATAAAADGETAPAPGGPVPVDAPVAPASQPATRLIASSAAISDRTEAPRRGCDGRRGRGGGALMPSPCYGAEVPSRPK